MGLCVGYLGWRAPAVRRPIGEIDMELVDQNESEVVWPKPFHKQRLVCVGERKEHEPALLTCNGACSKSHVKWTMHHMVNSSSFRCGACGTTRRWGLGFGFDSRSDR